MNIFLFRITGLASLRFRNDVMLTARTDKCHQRCRFRDIELYLVMTPCTGAFDGLHGKQDSTDQKEGGWSARLNLFEAAKTEPKRTSELNESPLKRQGRDHQGCRGSGKHARLHHVGGEGYLEIRAQGNDINRQSKERFTESGGNGCGWCSHNSLSLEGNNVKEHVRIGKYAGTGNTHAHRHRITGIRWRGYRNPQWHLLGSQQSRRSDIGRSNTHGGNRIAQWPFEIRNREQVVARSRAADRHVGGCGQGCRKIRDR